MSDIMVYRDIVRRGLIELEGKVSLPEGTRVDVIPEGPCAIDIRTSAITLKECMQKVRQVRAQLPKTGDSGVILRRLRKECTHRRAQQRTFTRNREN
jgi:hypothetical protein